MDQKFMARAIEIATQNVELGTGGPFGAVIVLDGKIIGEGCNRVTKNNDPTAHAEVQAIREACRGLENFDLSGAEIYTSCEPCPMCLSAIYWARLAKVYFANTKKDAANIEFDDDFIYQEISKKIEERSIPMIQMMRSSAISTFELWQKKTDKIKY